MDEPVRHLVAVAVVVIVGIALIALANQSGETSIVGRIGKAITDFIGRITTAG